MFCQKGGPSCEERFNNRTGLALVGLSLKPNCLRGCQYALDDVLMRGSFVMYTDRAFPVEGLLDETILILQSAGILDFWVKRITTVRGPRPVERTTIAADATPDEAFYIIAFGLTTALVVFIVEHVASAVHVRRKGLRYNDETLSRSTQNGEEGATSLFNVHRIT